MASSVDKLTPLQREVIEAFFDREAGFRLTGGAALAGFHLGHRSSDDIDLFTSDGDAFERGPFVLREVARVVGAETEVRLHAPSFARYAVRRGESEAVVVDLVLDPVPVAFAVKEETGPIRIDPIEEILVNKLTCILSRAEERDLVDLYFIEQKGLRIEEFFAAAMAKDGGCTPAVLAWLLSQIRIPDGIELAGGVSPADLRQFVDGLIVRLRHMAAPEA